MKMSITTNFFKKAPVQSSGEFWMVNFPVQTSLVHFWLRRIREMKIKSPFSMRPTMFDAWKIFQIHTHDETTRAASVTRPQNIKFNIVKSTWFQSCFALNLTVTEVLMATLPSLCLAFPRAVHLKTIGTSFEFFPFSSQTQTTSAYWLRTKLGSVLSHDLQQETHWAAVSLYWWILFTPLNQELN